MVAAGIENGALKKRTEKLGKGHTAPYHEHSQTEKPFQQVDVLVGTGQPKAQQNEEDGDGKGGQTETAGYELVGDKGSHRTARVAEHAAVVAQLAVLKVQNQTLVGRTGGEVGNEGYQHHYRCQ